MVSIFVNKFVKPSDGRYRILFLAGRPAEQRGSSKAASWNNAGVSKQVHAHLQNQWWQGVRQGRSMSALRQMEHSSYGAIR